LDGELPILELQPMEAIIAKATLSQRVMAGVFGGVGLISLLLATVGIYSVVTYAVAQRTRELGIRIAIGARPSKVVRMVLAGSLGLTAAGLGVGLLAAAGISQLLRSMLFGISTLDLTSFIGSLILLTSAAALASLLPALRATRLDPVLSLKGE
jgi:ABC-type antimicrobial peptide transport system permease subunit